MNFQLILMMCMLSVPLRVYSSQNVKMKNGEIYSKLEKLFSKEKGLVRAAQVSANVRRASTCNANSVIQDLHNLDVCDDVSNKTNSYILAQTPKKKKNITNIQNNKSINHSQAESKMQSNIKSQTTAQEMQGYSKEAWSAAFVEAAKNKEDLTHFFSRKNLMINKQDILGKTALMYAVEYGLKETVEVLLAKGAKSFSIKDFSTSDQYPKGMCAYDYAQGNEELQAIMWKRQAEDRARRNSIILQMPNIMGPVLEALGQPAPQEEALYQNEPK